MSGRTLGRYRLTTSVDEGVGVVVPAEDTLLDRQVGLLLVPVAVASDPERMTRIRHEVERAAGFVHPNVASIYGLEEDGGRLFVTLEPVAGRTLASLLRAGGLALEKTLEVALALVDVLISAKEAGVVHGALGPGDVLLADDGSITVGGFGLHELRLVVEAESDGGPSSAASYRPPEASPGLLPDHRADLFALGRLVEEMLAAGAPDSGAEGRLSEETTTELRGALERLLSEDPSRRPHSAAELQPCLERVQRDLLRDREPESEDLAVRRQLGLPTRWRLPAAAALLVVLAGGALWCGRGDGERTVEPAAADEASPAAVELVDLAVMPFAAGDDDDAFLATGFGREVTRLLSLNKRVSLIAAGSAARVRSSGSSREQVASRLGVAHLLEGSFHWQNDDDISRAEATVRLFRASDGEVLWSETLEDFFGEIAGLQNRVATGVARRLGAGGGSSARPVTDSPGAYEAYLEGTGRAAVATAPEEVRAALESFEQAVILDPGLLLAHTRQVGLWIELAASEPESGALAEAHQALAAAREIDLGDPEVRRAAGELELASDGAGSVAIKELKAALSGLPSHPSLLRSVALIDRREGRWDEAIAGLAAAVRRDPLDLDLRMDLVRTLAWNRRFDEATDQVERLADLLPDATEGVLMRADLLLREHGATDRARVVLEEIPETARSSPGWQERMLRLDLYQGEYESALARLPGLQLGEGEELIERAWIHRYMGQARRAAASFERARDRLDDRLEAEPDDPALSSLLGQAYGGTGGPLLAIRMGQRAVTQLPVTRDAVGGVELVERFARIYVLAGDHEHALDELAFLLEIPSPITVAVLRLDPAWDPLRDDARFQALLERFG